MPMDFPDLDSLILAADAHKFRKPNDGETEDEYRAALADHVAPIDRVESAEIRNKVGWDKFTPRQMASMVWQEPSRTRAEHVAWCKQRALQYADAGDVQNCVLSMLSDLSKHPATAGTHTESASITGLALLMGPRTAADARKWVEGFPD